MNFPLFFQLNLTIYFEGLDPHSKKFFTTELEPAVLELGEKIKVKLVPYGKAKVSTFQSSEGRVQAIR